MKMVEGFLLHGIHGIHVLADCAAIYQGVKNPPAVFSYPAKASPNIIDHAMMLTKMAADSIFRYFS